MGKTFGVNVVIGIPSFGMVSTYFLQAKGSQQFPLVSSTIDHIVLNKPIAEARNEIVEFALAQGANYIYWLDDDVIAPPDAFLKMYMSGKDIVNGVYWSKSNPPMPLMFRNHLEGPYMDWHVGDFIEVDAAGNGLTLVKTDVYRTISEKIGGPWYSTEYTSFKGASNQSAANNTEDLYFYWKARRAGFKVWVDTSIQAYHYEKNSQVMYAAPPNAPQMNPAWEIKVPGEKIIADIGSGPVSPYMSEGRVVSFDIREEVKPDIVCDVRKLPVPDETFDIVFSSHTLEHFAYGKVDKILKEWSRVLKVGGELRLVVPNLKFIGERLAKDELIATDYWILYGEQDYPKNFHAAGFTPKGLLALVESLGIYEDIQIREGNPEANGPEGWNLQLKATKAKSQTVDNITPEWVDAPPPNMNNMWPMRLYQEYNERPMTPEEIVSDKLKWLEGTSKEEIEQGDFDVFKDGAVPPDPQPKKKRTRKKKVEDGLDSIS